LHHGGNVTDTGLDALGLDNHGGDASRETIKG